MLPVSVFLLGWTYPSKRSHRCSVEPQWHGDLDTYGSFCITPPIEQIATILVELYESNRRWDSRTKSDSQAPRNLDVRELHWFPIWPETLNFSQMTKDPFVVRECTLLVLRPEMFLPDNRPLPINTERALRDPGGPPLALSKDSSWIPYHSTSTLPYLMDPHNKPFEEFDFKSRRPPQDSLSVFSLLVNANSKLQAVRGESCAPILEFYASTIERVVDEIFHIR